MKYKISVMSVLLLGSCVQGADLHLVILATESINSRTTTPVNPNNSTFNLVQGQGSSRHRRTASDCSDIKPDLKPVAQPNENNKDRKTSASKFSQLVIGQPKACEEKDFRKTSAVARECADCLPLCTTCLLWALQNGILFGCL